MVFVYILCVEGLLYGLDCVVFVYCVNYISYVYKIGGYDINYVFIII